MGKTACLVVKPKNAIRVRTLLASDTFTSKKVKAYSTVTDLARFRGWSMSVPLRTAMW